MKNEDAQSPPLPQPWLSVSWASAQPTPPREPAGSVAGTPPLREPAGSVAGTRPGTGGARIAATLLCVLLLTFWTGCGTQGEPIGNLEKPLGQVQLRSGPDGTWKAVADPTPIRLGDVVKTGEDGQVTMRWKNGDSLEIRPLTAFRFEKDHLGEQTEGTAIFRIQKKPEEIRIRTPHAVTGILGTTFAELVTATSTRVLLSEGKLRVGSLAGSATVDLEAGQETTAGADGRITPPAATNLFDAEALFHPGRSGTPKLNQQ